MPKNKLSNLKTYNKTDKNSLPDYLRMRVSVCDKNLAKLWKKGFTPSNHGSRGVFYMLTRVRDQQVNDWP